MPALVGKGMSAIWVRRAASVVPSGSLGKVSRNWRAYKPGPWLAVEQESPFRLFLEQFQLIRAGGVCAFRIEEVAFTGAGRAEVRRR